MQRDPRTPTTLVTQGSWSEIGGGSTGPAQDGDWRGLRQNPCLRWLREAEMEDQFTLLDDESAEGTKAWEGAGVLGGVPLNRGIRESPMARLTFKQRPKGGER